MEPHPIRSHRAPRPHRARIVGALSLAAVLVSAAVASAAFRPTAATSAGPGLTMAEIAQACKDRLAASPRPPAAARTWLASCVTAGAPTSSPSGSPSPPPGPTVTPTATPTPTVTTAPPTTTPPATTPPVTTPPPTTDPPVPGPLDCPAFPAFPDENCTGWQHTGVTLHACGDQSGSATHLGIANAVYDSCLFPDSVVIQAANITIKRSWVQGVIRNQMRTADDKPDYRGAKLIDVEVGPGGGPDFAGISNGSSFSCLRCHVHGTASGMHIGDNNSLIDSYLHTFQDTGSHGAAAGTGQGMGDNSIVQHNNMECSRDTGAAHCSSALSLYDEPTLNNVLVVNNLFNSVSGYGMYGGGPRGTNIRILNNVFGQKFYPTCGLFGPVAAYYSGNAGNQWSGNKYQNGVTVNPSSST